MTTTLTSAAVYIKPKRTSRYIRLYTRNFVHYPFGISGLFLISPTKSNDVTPLDIDNYSTSRSPAHPRPIYSLSNRLLAYVSPLTPQEPPLAATPGQAHTVASVPAPTPEAPLKLSLNMTQADLGNAAVKIGGSMLSGMKTLGGMAFSAARAGVNAAVDQGVAHACSASVAGSGTPEALSTIFPETRTRRDRFSARVPDDPAHGPARHGRGERVRLASYGNC